MKSLKVFIKNEVEEYRVGERAESHPQEFVKDIVYSEGNYTVTFDEAGEWFKSFTNLPVVYQETGLSSKKSNKEKLQF